MHDERLTPIRQLHGKMHQSDVSPRHKAWMSC